MTGESNAQKPSTPAFAIFLNLFAIEVFHGTFSTTVSLFLRKSVPFMVHKVIFVMTKIIPIKIPGRMPARKSFGMDTFVDAP